MGLLFEKIEKYETVQRGNCRDCGNPWWFSQEHGYECTMCGKAHGRDTSDTYIPKVKQGATVCRHNLEWPTCVACRGNEKMMVDPNEPK